MSLTTGRGPLSVKPAGRFEPPVPAGVVYVEPFRRRVRGLLGDEVVVDSDRVVLVHRPGQPPSYAFPSDDVAPAGGAVASPEPAAPGYVQVPWDDLDAWYEEEEEVFGHPRNPYHRIDCLRTSRRFRADVAGVTLVDTTESVVLYETALEPCFYIDRRHVALHQLVASATTTFCPYKGTASYWDAVIDDVVVPDVVWSYEEPTPESTAIKGLLSFDPSKAELHHDLPSGAWIAE